MMDVSLFFIVFTFFFSPALGGYDGDIQCLNGIRTALDMFTFGGGDTSDYYVNACTGEFYVNSMWAAAKLYCTEKEIDAGSELFAGYCIEYGMVELLPYSEVLPTLTDKYLASLPVVGYDDIDATKIWNTSVLISESFYIDGYRTTVRSQ